MKSPNRRQQVARRRLVVVGGVVALALAAGAIGSIATQPGDEAAPRHAETGPFSYFPSD